MDAQERQILEALKSHVACSKNFACVSSKFKNLCRAEYQLESDELECKEESPIRCNFSIRQGNRMICSCDLRIYIEKNLDKWVQQSSAY